MLQQTSEASHQQQLGALLKYLSRASLTLKEMALTEVNEVLPVALPPFLSNGWSGFV